MITDLTNLIMVNYCNVISQTCPLNCCYWDLLINMRGYCFSRDLCFSPENRNMDKEENMEMETLSKHNGPNQMILLSICLALYTTFCFLSISLIFSRLSFSASCSLSMSLSSSLRCPSQASLALLYSSFSLSLCLYATSCICSSSARSRRHSCSRLCEEMGGSSRRMGNYHRALIFVDWE